MPNALKINIYSVIWNVEGLANLTLVEFIGCSHVDDSGATPQGFFDFIISNAEYG